ncbi:hypothetical protein SRABI106_04447 [Rahnella aquatilis]|nr:hypothetical protein SRABI106_04447 [Rahnella aquatilis]
MTHFADHLQLLKVISVTHAVLIHHIQHNFTCAAFLHFLNPVDSLPGGDLSTRFLTGKLMNLISSRLCIVPRIDTHDDTLYTIPVGKAGDQCRIRQGRGINRNLICTKLQNLAGIFKALNATRHAERDINNFSHARYPAFIHYAAVA